MTDMTFNRHGFAAVDAGELSLIDGGSSPSKVLGSIAGALIGFAIGGPIGAAVGAAIPHVFD